MTKHYLSRVTGIYLLALLFVCWFVLRESVDAEPTLSVDDTIFDAPAAGKILDTLYLGIGAHPAGSTENKKLQARLIEAIKAAGYQHEIQQGYVCSKAMVCGHVENVIAWHGKPESQHAILINAHYDSVPTGPGVSDNGVNVAIALQIAEQYKAWSTETPIVLLFSDAEEIGTLGAEAFMGHPFAEHIGLVFNLESRGTSGRSLMFQTSNNNTQLIELLSGHFTSGKANAFFQGVYQYLPNDTDFSRFKEAGMKGYNFAFIGDLPHYHTYQDNLENVSAESLHEQGRLVASLVKGAVISGRLEAFADEKGDVQYIDILGSRVWYWSSGSMQTLAAAILLLVLGLALMKQGEGLKRRRIFSGALLLIVSIVLAAIATYGVMLLIVRLQPILSPWSHFATASHFTVWSVAILLGSASFRFFTRKSNITESLFAVLLAFSVLAAVLSVTFPALGYLYLFPVLPAILLLLVGRFSSAHTGVWLVPVVTLLLFVFFSLLALDIAYLVEDAVSLAVAGYALAVFLAPVGALLAVLSKVTTVGGSIHKLAELCTVAVVVVLLWQISRPLQLEPREAANLVVYQDASHAYWLLDKPLRRVNPVMREQLQFEKHSKQMPLYSRFRDAAVVRMPDGEAKTGFTAVSVKTLQGESRLEVELLPAERHYYVNIIIPQAVGGNLLLNERFSYPLESLNVDSSGNRVLRLYGHSEMTSHLTLEYGPNGAGSIVIEEEMQLMDDLNNKQITDLYRKYYYPAHKGNRTIVSRQFDLAQ